LVQPVEPQLKHEEAIVTSKTPGLDKVFIQKQRLRLTKLREDLLRTTQVGETEENVIHTQSAGEAHESEDDAQKLAMLEIDGNLVERNVQRLARIARALQKIEDGTYGFSDASGEPIPRERLEAVPEAIHTLSELKAYEFKDSHAAVKRV
jgi:DnaK suppressor protein